MSQDPTENKSIEPSIGNLEVKGDRGRIFVKDLFLAVSETGFTVTALVGARTIRLVTETLIEKLYQRFGLRVNRRSFNNTGAYRIDFRDEVEPGVQTEFYEFLGLAGPIEND